MALDDSLLHPRPMLVLSKPSKPLSPYVDGYLHVRDGGAHRGRPIDTSPRPGGVLTVNLGEPNRTAAGEPTPVLSLLGIQTHARAWRSEGKTHFVMALLTPAGLARLAPRSGDVIANGFIDLAALVGDGLAGSLLADASARPEAASAALEAWLCKRLLDPIVHPEMRSADAACAALAMASRVDAAAERLGVSRRHLVRVVSRDLGVGPKALLELHRLDRSLRAVQAGACGSSGFADQAHQIREWRRRLATTPGRYARDERSPLAARFARSACGSAFYL